jgi:hypothetical protein
MAQSRRFLGLPRKLLETALSPQLLSDAAFALQLRLLLFPRLQALRAIKREIRQAAGSLIVQRQSQNFPPVVEKTGKTA